MVDYFFIPIGKTHILHFNVQPVWGLFFAVNVNLRTLVDFFHTVNRSIDHGKHKEHFSRAFQLAIYHERRY